VRNQLAQFGYLQLLDVLTTLLYMAHRGQESNPLIKLFRLSVKWRTGVLR